MKYLLRLASLSLAFLALTGCNTTLNTVKPDAATGYYATQSKLQPADVRVSEKFDPKYTEMLYVKINTENPNQRFVDFFVNGFTNMGVFKKVVTKDDLQSMVIERNLGSKVSNVSDLVALNNLSKEIGPFLIVEPNAYFKGGYRFNGVLKATDASTGKTVLLIENSAINMAGLDDPLFHPMLNGFINWTRGLPVAQKN